MRFLRTRVLGAAFILLAGTRWVEGGTVLTFDDIPAHQGNNTSDVIREEYAGLGIHFNRDGRHSGIVRLGLSQGDPGNWSLEGSNGPQFLGHNSYGRTGLIEFDMPVMSFKIDAAEGHAGVSNLTFQAYGTTGLLESVTLPSSVPDVWNTITLSAAGIRRIEYSSPHNFALDNMVFTPVPEPSTFVLLGIGALGFLAWAWRRKRTLPSMAACLALAALLWGSQPAAAAVTFLRSVGQYGTGNGQFDGPLGVAVDPLGNVWATDADNERIQEFTSTGAFLRSISLRAVNGDSPYYYPWDVGADAAGNIWVTDQHAVQEFTSGGALVKRIVAGNTGPNAANFAPTDVAMHSSGKFWVCDWGNCCIEAFSSNGTYLAKYGALGSGDGQFKYPRALSLDPSGNLWVVDSGNNRMQQLSGSGGYLTQFGATGSGNGQFKGPVNMALDSSGNIWVADTQNNRLQQFSVPEPSTLALLGVGAIGLLAYVWRRRRVGGSPLCLSWFSHSRATSRPQVQRRCVMRGSMIGVLAVMLLVPLFAAFAERCAGIDSNVVEVEIGPATTAPATTSLGNVLVYWDSYKSDGREKNNVVAILQNSGATVTQTTTSDAATFGAVLANQDALIVAELIDGGFATASDLNMLNARFLGFKPYVDSFLASGKPVVVCEGDGETAAGIQVINTLGYTTVTRGTESTITVPLVLNDASDPMLLGVSSLTTANGWMGFNSTDASLHRVASYGSQYVLASKPVLGGRFEVVGFDYYSYTPNMGAVLVNAAAVPEPSTIVLLGVGAIGLLAWAWRRRRS